jgi:hypothetical protein
MPRPTAPSVSAARKDARALELRNVGLSYRQIGERMGISGATAYKYVTRGLDRTRREPADLQRQLERERLDAWQVTAERIARTRHVLVQAGKPVIDPETGRPYADHGPVLAALGTLLRIAERRSKLEGLDAPARVDAQIRAEVYSVDALQAEIARIEQELAGLGPPTPPAAETITPPAGEPDPVALAAAVEAALDAAGVPPEQREAAYQAVERRLREREP